ncbi:metallophosphoesterase family protein [Actinomadura oligospora]|uniref:metallophosphoesterase family protein n=1 Tax=Actinomadura oligospora TaxID=111804 RepID=UPI00047A9726|nr:metallophosphoesterase [Actinomadura oligospora]
MHAQDRPRQVENSRTSEAGAGWVCGRPGTFSRLMPEHVRAFSWRRPTVLWRSRNDVVARWWGDPSNELRKRAVAALSERRGAPASLTMHRPESEFSFVVMGDTGEGDRSQYAVVPPLLSVGADTDFLVIASDVIYPTGDAGGYEDKFFRPYAGYPGPIYAVPGNHDWYDGLRGFLNVFCQFDMDCTPSWNGRFSWLARRFWRKSGQVDAASLAEIRSRYRGAAGQRAVQPAPYWAIDTPGLRIIGIDTGILGGVDDEQGRWLKGVSAGPKPKLLVTGKPLVVEDMSHPCAIEGGGTVDAIVRDPANNYVAAIGGDIHRYERYPVKVGDRTVQYVVSGGGGAFMHATHIIPKTTLVDEPDFRCYPLRGDSLSRYSHLYGRWFRMPWLFDLTPREATAAVEKRLGIRAGRVYEDEEVSLRARFVAALLGVPRGRWRGPGKPPRLPVKRLPQRFRSEMADWDSPPFFKSFLRLDVTEGELRVRCYAVTGCGDHENDPPIEDEFVIPLG